MSVTSLSAISADIGEATAGKVRNSGNTAGILLSGSLPGTWTTYLDLTATGANPILKHPLFTLNADGSVTSNRFRVKCVQITSDFTWTQNTTADVTWNSETADTGGLHDTSSNTQRITIPTNGNTGFWVFNFSGVVGVTGGLGDEITATLEDSSANVLAQDRSQAFGTVETAFVQLTAFVHAPSAGEWFKIRLKHFGSAAVTPTLNRSLSYFEAIHAF